MHIIGHEISQKTIIHETENFFEMQMGNTNKCDTHTLVKSIITTHLLVKMYVGTIK